MRIIHFASLMVVCISCTPKHGKPVSFYYWKTAFSLTTKEASFIEQQGVKRMYLRYFDVTMDHGNVVPRAPLTFSQELPGSVEGVPVIYIRNEALTQNVLPIHQLAARIVKLVVQMNRAGKVNCKGIQFDCDWNKTSKDKYFALLMSIDSLTDLELSATIRLHQVKYPNITGIPPVKRGVLMYYNMGKIDDEGTNSIYDRATARRYTSMLKSYSLPLDVALPIFSWAVQRRSKKVIALLGKTDTLLFNDHDHFIHTGPNTYAVKEKVFLKGKYFEPGDKIEVESVTADDLNEMAEDLSRALPREEREVIYYDFDKTNFRYDNDALFSEVAGAI